MVDKDAYKILNIDFLNEESVEDRQILVTLTNGTKITIVACYNSWQQYGGTEAELWATVPVAERNNKWLHGKGVKRL